MVFLVGGLADSREIKLVGAGGYFVTIYLGSTFTTEQAVEPHGSTSSNFNFGDTY
jgi:hypothetical protein